jgi:hypothetical protein
MFMMNMNGSIAATSLGVGAGHLQKLKEAVERRKVQNRLAQRRYWGEFEEED